MSGRHVTSRDVAETMLRVTKLSDTKGTVTLRVEGKIEEAGGLALEAECLQDSWSRREIVLDFSAVTDVDSRGAVVVSRLQAGGVRLIHCSPLIGDRIRNHTNP